MLRIGDDWAFEIDEQRSKIVLTPRGVWSLEIVCVRTEVAVLGGATENFSPKLTIDNLHFDGEDWRQMVGFEIAQEGAWRGEADPEANLFVVQNGEIYQSKLRIVAQEGTSLRVELEGICDVFFDDGHDTDVDLNISASVRFDGVRFRFRAEGVDSRVPDRKAIELLSQYLDPEVFAAPEISKRGDAGSFTAFFAPIDPDAMEDAPVDDEIEDEADDDEDVDPETALLRQSAAELLVGLVKQEWLELEEGGDKSLVADLVEILEMGGRGTERAGRLVDWLLERDEVVDVHCTDDQLAAVLDKWW